MSLKVQATTKYAFDLFMQGQLALSRISENGIRIDVDQLERSLKSVKDDVATIKQELEVMEEWRVWKKRFGTKMSLDSTQQLAAVLFDELGHECKSVTKTGQRGASVKALQDVDLPFVKKLFEYKNLEKTGSTFLKNIKKETVDGFIHPSFNLNTVITYRSSSSSINFQNQPKRNEKMAKLVRSCFVPRRGRHFWEIDFKGAEVALCAIYCKDPVLVHFCNTDPGLMHRDVAVDMFMISPNEVTKRVRDRAKNEFTFATFYGSFYKQTAKAMWEDVQRDKKLTVGDGGTWLRDHLTSKGITELGDVNLSSRTDPQPGTFSAHVKKVERKLWQRFKVYEEWRRSVFEDYLKVGHFDSLVGFRYDGEFSRNDVISYLPQGSAFHCLLWCLVIKLQRWILKNKMRTKIVGQIHDSAEGDSPPDEIQDVFGKAKEIIEVDLPKHWPWVTVPLKVDMEAAPLDVAWYFKEQWELSGGTWGPAKKGHA
jgi:DNA polymerase I-like protein with 3'-5' exonuclease and polymerase domains